MYLLLDWYYQLKDYFFPPKLTRRYNWVKDTVDHRDVKFKYKAIRLMPSVDLRPQCPPVVNQGNLGSCTANALAGALGFLEMMEEAAGQTGQAEEFGSGFFPFSRLFIYWNERVIEGDTSEDNGAQLRDGITSLANTGACSELLWPYNTSVAFQTPTPTCFAQATLHKISSYQSLDGSDITALKTCLASGYPFVFGFQVFESFESETVATNGILPMPSLAEQCMGGHAVMCVGYSDMTRTFTVRNSWGSDWGDEGYFHMPYAYMTNSDLASDFWTLRK
jgi:C1A family cysteine protease